MIFLYVFLGLLTAAVLVLFYPVKFNMVLKNDRLDVKYKILFFWVTVKDRENKSGFFEKFLDKREKKVEEDFKKLEDADEIEDIASEFKNHKNFAIILLFGIKSIFRSMRFFNLEVSVGAQDSSEVALRYGQVMTFMSFFVNYFLCNTARKRVIVYPDFSCAEDSDLGINCSFSINLFRTLRVILTIVLKILREESKNERKTA